MPSVVLSAVVGSAIFASVSSEQNVHVQVATGLLSLSSTVLAAMQTFLGFAERSREHETTARAFGAIRRQLSELAARHAMAQWRPIDEGRVFVTNRRFAVQGSQQWNDIWYGSIRMSDCDSLAILIHLDG